MKILKLFVFLLASSNGYAGEQYLSCDVLNNPDGRAEFTFVLNEAEKYLYSTQFSKKLELSSISSSSIVGYLDTEGSYKGDEYSRIEFNLNRISGTLLVIYTEKQDETCDREIDKDCGWVTVFRTIEAKCTKVEPKI